MISAELLGFGAKLECCAKQSIGKFSQYCFQTMYNTKDKIIINAFKTPDNNLKVFILFVAGPRSAVGRAPDL